MPDHRGPLLIHASKGCTEPEFASAAIWMHEQHLATPIEWRLDRQHPDAPKIQALKTLPRGGIVGVCDLVDVVRTFGTGHQRRALSGGGSERPCLLCGAVASVHGELAGPCPKADPWAIPGEIGLVLANVRPLPFVPFKGALGFFDVPDGLVPGVRP